MRCCGGIRSGALLTSICRMRNLAELVLFRWPKGYSTRPSFEQLSRVICLRSLTLPASWDLDGLEKVSRLTSLAVECRTDQLHRALNGLPELTALYARQVSTQGLEALASAPACRSLASLRVGVVFSQLPLLVKLPCWPKLRLLELMMLDALVEAATGTCDSFVQSLLELKDLQEVRLRVPRPTSLLPFLRLGERRLVREVRVAALEGSKAEVTATRQALEAFEGSLQQIRCRWNSSVPLMLIGGLVNRYPDCALRVLRVWLPLEVAAASERFGDLVKDYEEERSCSTGPDSKESPSSISLCTGPAGSRRLEFVQAWKFNDGAVTSLRCACWFGS